MDPEKLHEAQEKLSHWMQTRVDENLESCIGLCSEVIDLDPQSIPARKLRAQAYIYLEKGANALDDLNFIIERKPEPDHLNDRGLIYSNLGRFAEAIADFSDQLILRPQDIVGHINLAQAHAQNGNLDAAIELGYKGLRIEKNPALFNNLGQALLRQGKADEAITILSEGISHAHNSQYRNMLLFLYANRGDGHLAQEETYSAEKDYNNSLSIFNSLGLPRESSWLAAIRAERGLKMLDAYSPNIESSAVEKGALTQDGIDNYFARTGYEVIARAVFTSDYHTRGLQSISIQATQTRESNEQIFGATPHRILSGQEINHADSNSYCNYMLLKQAFRF